MNEIDKYIKAKKRLEEFESWSSLIGKEYFGGTLGKGGKYGSLNNASGTLTIYYQEYDGDCNHYELNTKFNEELSQAMIKHSDKLIESIRNQLIDNVELAKSNAKALAEEILIPCKL